MTKFYVKTKHDDYVYINSSLMAQVKFDEANNCIYFPHVYIYFNKPEFDMLKNHFQELVAEDSKEEKQSGRLEDKAYNAAKQYLENRAEYKKLFRETGKAGDFTEQERKTIKEQAEARKEQAREEKKGKDRHFNSIFEEIKKDLENIGSRVSREEFLRIKSLDFSVMNKLFREMCEMKEKENIINKLQSNPWDPRKPEYNEKGELKSITIEFKDEQDNTSEED